jgi:hypothetical protein
MKRTKASFSISRRPSHKPDRDRAVFELLRAIKGLSSSEVAAKASYGKGYGNVNPQTIRRLRYAKGGTRYPQHATMVAIAKSVGMTYKLSKSGG